VSGVALIAFTTAPAYAAGTSAGDYITNTVQVDYEVGGFDQTQIEAEDTITVDRKIDLTVAETGFIGQTAVSPNQTQAVIQFAVTNDSNDVVDLALSTTLATGNDFTLTNVTIYSDANGNGVIDGADAVITFLDDMAEDETRNVIVIADIPITAAAGESADVVLTATAHEGGVAGLGTIYDAANTSDDTEANTDDGTENAANIDTVLADAETDVGGVDDDEFNGQYSAIDGYVVSTAALSVVKQSRIVSDPINGTTNPKPIPGAVVEYCILVANGTGGANADAENVDVQDTLPADLELVDSSLFVNGSVASPAFTGQTLTGGTCTLDGTAFGAGETQNVFPTQDVVDGTLGTAGTIESGEIFTLYFQAEIR
jgi:uncharacterized repeat protein (TIGR01451 family)